MAATGDTRGGCWEGLRRGSAERSALPVRGAAVWGQRLSLGPLPPLLRLLAGSRVASAAAATTVHARGRRRCPGAGAEAVEAVVGFLRMRQCWKDRSLGGPTGAQPMGVARRGGDRGFPRRRCPALEARCLETRGLGLWASLPRP